MDFRTDDLLDSNTRHAVEVRRVFISRYFYAMHGGKVRRGPLKGFTLNGSPSWEPAGVASKLFGLYEQEILTLLEQAKGRKRTLVNLGADDGYYGVGLVATNYFHDAVCYELSEEGRALIQRTAELNGISGRIKIMSEATSDFPNQLRQLNIAVEGTLILCDVEGAEFGIFSEACLASLEGAEIIIELHDFMIPNGGQALGLLLSRAARYFDVSSVKTGARDLSSIPDLDSVNDTDRWLICSEGRAKLMTWLHFAPKK